MSHNLKYHLGNLSREKNKSHIRKINAYIMYLHHILITDNLWLVGLQGKFILLYFLRPFNLHVLSLELEKIITLLKKHF